MTKYCLALIASLAMTQFAHAQNEANQLTTDDSAVSADATYDFANPEFRPAPPGHGGPGNGGPGHGPGNGPGHGGPGGPGGPGHGGPGGPGHGGPGPGPGHGGPFPGNPGPRVVYLTCESQNYHMNQCGFNNNGLRNINISRVLSSSPCIPNVSYGFYSNAVWVDKGCRATFQLNY